ncbi:PRC-barrel domain-containing protein [Wenzhouxiangella sediminis]|uniref:PRC-barrel domain containing protein n=1 Tax=Wenzhouxiangella sediminis TaxID=1792836 RepID=A0A3E1K990_9GAMM|nr:PRC-barrel domain-containing protein [Wenzhouxiangella sediminis]RFF30672.1 PRC-barrel domain containing protein [Wenzhouxiangella sediminis]
MKELRRNMLGAGPAPGPNPESWPLLLSATTLTGDEVCNRQGERLGYVRDLMLDMDSGRIRYVVMSCGGFLGMGDRLLAIPWTALDLDVENLCFLLDVDIDRIKSAPGFDKDHWPDMADEQWAGKVRYYYRRLKDGSKSLL